MFRLSLTRRNDSMPFDPRPVRAQRQRSSQRNLHLLTIWGDSSVLKATQLLDDQLSTSLFRLLPTIHIVHFSEHPAHQLGWLGEVGGEVSSTRKDDFRSFYETELECWRVNVQF